jgi:hypothetical protein
MGNWLFLMLLYAFFGWMKKKQKDKFIKKNEDNSSEKSRSIIEFGEGILNALIGDEKGSIQNQENLENRFEYEDNDLASDIKLDEEALIAEDAAEIFDEKLKTKSSISFSKSIVKKFPKNNGNILAGLIDLNDPVKTGVIFKEIFDKPKALRRDRK